MSQVSDYNIANASGASVRSDLNAVFDAIKTLNSGGSDPSNTEAFMPYVDTADSNNLKIRNAANNGFVTVGSVNSPNLGLLPVSGGTMTGQLLADDSAGASAPAIAFDGDTNTGMYRSASNKISFSVGGSSIATLESNGLFINSISNVAKGLFFNDNDNSAHVAIVAPGTLNSSITLKLPATTGTAGQFLSVSSSNHSSTNAELEFSTVTGVPRGSVFCIAHTSMPSGYLECNGDALPNGTGTVQGITANFAALRALIGANLPDLRGEFIRGFDNGKGTDNGRSMLTSQGDENKSHNHSATSNTSLSQTPHNHAYNISHVTTSSVQHISIGTSDRRMCLIDITGHGNPNGTVHANHANLSSSTTTSIGNSGSENRPRNIAMMYIIKF